jgi:alpha-beta hydrolase superfamily lysophospholipase
MTDYLDFEGPSELRTRGTVLVAPGRGETSATYGRFGRRIAADSYRVRVLPELPAADSAGAAVRQLGDALSTALDGIDGDLVRPLVLVGADICAAALAALVANETPAAAWWPDAVVLAALPGYGAHEIEGGWESELDARSHCPVHRGVLSGDASIQRGVLSAPVDDALLDLAYESTSDRPQLLLVGDADPLADRDLLTRAAKALPAAGLSVVHGAHHDVLNDLQHRSVAAAVVTFLEIVKGGQPLQSIVQSESAAW